MLAEPSTSAVREPAHEPARPWVSAGLFAALGLTVLLPFGLIVLWSFAQRWVAPDLLPEAWTTVWWREILGDRMVLQATATSTLIAVAVTLLSALLALPTAWALAKFPLRHKRAVEVFVLAPIIVPGIVVAVGIGEVFVHLGLAFSVPGVILVQTVGTLPLMIQLLAAGFQAMPDELMHAARSLGATPLRAFWHVVLPLAKPSLMAGGLLSFVGSFEEFEKSFVVGAPVVQTLPILVYSHLDSNSLQFPTACVVALLLLLPVIAVFVLTGRFLRDDLMAAGMGKV